MARILRGEIRWADLNPVRGREQAGLRPVVKADQPARHESPVSAHISLIGGPKADGYSFQSQLGFIDRRNTLEARYGVKYFTRPRNHV